MRFAKHEIVSFARSISREPWQNHHRIASLYCAVRDTQSTFFLSRIYSFLDEHYVMDNLLEGIRKMDNGQNVSEFLTNNFFYHAFSLMRIWLEKSADARLQLLHQRSLFDVLVPISRKTWLDTEVKKQLASVLLIYIDGSCPSFPIHADHHDIVTLSGAIASTLYPKMKDFSMPFEAYFELVVRGEMNPDGDDESRIVLESFFRRAWVDLLRRARDLMTKESARKARGFVTDMEKLFMSRHMRLGCRARGLLNTNEYVSKQEKVEKGCELLALHVGMTLFREFLKNIAARREERPKKKPKFSSSNFIAQGALVSRLVLPFCSVPCNGEGVEFPEM